MKTSNQFLDAIKAMHGFTSDYQLCKFLEIRSGRISGYRNNRTHFDEDTCIIVAQALGLEPGYVMACIAAERTKSKQAKAVWKRTAEVLYGLAAALAVIAFLPAGIMSAFSLPGDHGSLALLGLTLGQGANTVYYVKSRFSTAYQLCIGRLRTYP